MLVYKTSEKIEFNSKSWTWMLKKSVRSSKLKYPELLSSSVKEELLEDKDWDDGDDDDNGGGDDDNDNDIDDGGEFLFLTSIGFSRKSIKSLVFW